MSVPSCTAKARQASTVRKITVRIWGGGEIGSCPAPGQWTHLFVVNGKKIMEGGKEGKLAVFTAQIPA